MCPLVSQQSCEVSVIILTIKVEQKGLSTRLSYREQALIMTLTHHRNQAICPKSWTPFTKPDCLWELFSHSEPQFLLGTTFSVTIHGDHAVPGFEARIPLI